MEILLSNDDGIHSKGLIALYNRLRKIGKVWVVAPMEERSICGHALTVHHPLRIMEIEEGFYGINGSPADCIFIAIREIMKKKPDLVVSGVNRGSNLGQDVYYSGTVSAAREACMCNVPALAVSLAVDFSVHRPEQKIHYETAVKYAADVIGAFKKKKYPAFNVINLNVPDLPANKVKGIKITRQGFRLYKGNVLKRVDGRGKTYFWIGGRYDGFHRAKDTDCDAVEQGYASLTPMQLDTTDYSTLKLLNKMWPNHGRGKE